MSREIFTDEWTLTVPAGVSGTSPLVVMPTVHPRGDRRILRTAQAALDAGNRVHIIWLGEGTPLVSAEVSETLLPPPAGPRERVWSTRSVARAGNLLNADIWHIHDFYMLPWARRWRRRSLKPVIYDVHEFYPEYYSGLGGLPGCLRKPLRWSIDRFESRSAQALGAVSVADRRMTNRFLARDILIAQTANYPPARLFSESPPAPFADRRWRVVHTGTLTESYGTALLLSLVERSQALSLPFAFTVIARFPTSSACDEFMRDAARFVEAGVLEVVPPMGAHEVPSFLRNYGFGLSLLAAGGQNDGAVPSKNFEYVLGGLVDVVTPRAEQARWAKENAVVVVGEEPDVDAMLDHMMELASAPGRTSAALAQRRADAFHSFTWEANGAAALTSLYSLLRNPVA